MAVMPPLAIVGAACRMPGGDGLDAFGDLLMAGRSAVGEIPDDRWTKARYFHPLPGQPGKTYTFAAGCLDNIDAFDATFFGISPREAASLDPQQRLMLELAYEAIEDAGLLPSQLTAANVGVFIGASSWDFAAASFSDVASLDAYAMQGAALSSISNRVSYIFGLRGPSLTVDTACSSSLVALHLACEAIRRGEIGLAIVGGVNLLLAPQSFVGFARASMLSRVGRCHPFDSRADGYVRAEGGGAIILKPLAEALASHDEIRAVVRGTGINSDGRTSGLAAPNREAQAALLRQVYADAEISPDELDYFEAHGTGTPVGDPIEAYAIGEALARRRRRSLPVGSVKSNVGHLEPASGMAGLMKLIVAFREGVVPASLNFIEPNPKIPFRDLNLTVTASPLPLPEHPTQILTGINSFGFGGTNAHAILERPLGCKEPTSGKTDSTSVPLLVSARCADALRALVASWRDLVVDAPTAHLPALLRGAAQYRDQYQHRLIVVGGTAPELAARLDGWLDKGRAAGVITGQVGSGGLCWVFSGNGSQWPGMALDAIALSPDFRKALAEVDELLATELGWSVIARLSDHDLGTGIRNTAVAQPLLFAIQVATVCALRQFGVRADACIGHSAGEIAAAWASGALALEQACHVIVQRSLLQARTHGAGRMTTLDLDVVSARSLIGRVDPDLAVSAVNSASAVTIAGPVNAIQQLRAVVADNKISSTELDLDYAFHCALMDPIRAPLLAALDGLRSAHPTMQLISTVTGTDVAAGEMDAEYWWRNVRLPVRFLDGVETLLARGVRNFVEIGPQPVLQAYLRDAMHQRGVKGRTFGVLSRRSAETDPFAVAAGMCYLAGADLAAAPVLQGPVTRRGLPGYKWQRRRFTLDRTVEALEATKLQHDHPLLGFRDPQGRDLWASHLSLVTDPWLADHVLQGSVVLPAAAMIDIAMAAARVRHGSAPAWELQDLEIGHQMVLEVNSMRDCRTTVAPDGQLSLASRVRLSEDTLQTHATCRVMPCLSTKPILSPIDADDAEVIEAEEVYAAAESRHLHYGPAFRTVARVWRTDANRAVAELIARGPDRASEGYSLDPTLLDGGLQVVLVMASRHPELAVEGAIVPWRAGRVRLLRPSSPRPTRAAVHIRHVGPRSLCVDVALTDAVGDPIMELIDCWCVCMPASARGQFDQAFWTAYIPSARQPSISTEHDHVLGGVLAAVPELGDMPESVLLADGFASAAAFEALRPIAAAATGRLEAGISDRPLTATALAWLAEDGLAARDPEGWRLADTTDLPPSTEIWRSLFVELPQGAAECALLASLGPALTSADSAVLQLSPVLKEQLLFSSPSGTAAAEGLLRSLEAVCVSWPKGRCLRVAITGALHAPFLQRIINRIADYAIPLRLVAWGRDADWLAGAQDLVARTPGASARLWDTLSDHDRQGFDVVIGLFGLSMPGPTQIVPASLCTLLGPTGLLLCAEPTKSRAADLGFGPGLDPQVAPDLRHPQSWCQSLREAGVATVQHRLLGGAVWPVALLIGAGATLATERPIEVKPIEHGTDLVVFAAPDDPLAEALAARQSVLRLLPLAAAKDALTAPFAARLRHVLLLAADGAEDDSSAEALAELLVGISAALLSAAAPEAPRLWLVSMGSPLTSSLSAALAGLRRVAANELPGIDCRTISLDADLPASEAAERLLQEIANPDDEQEVYWQTAARLVPRLRRGLPEVGSIDGPRRLDVSRPGLVSSLTWKQLVPRQPDVGEVAIEVYAAALNLRDVMWAQGLLPDEAVLEGVSGPTLGLECAGVVTAVGTGVDDLHTGDRVMAVAPAALATHVVTRRGGVMRIPAQLEFCSAATIPVAFITAAYALGRLGRLQAGEHVLVHSGAGGVGLAAVQYALEKGAIVHATAGSQMRRQMLRMLGATGVYDSRSAGFADEVLAATDGQGVDVVLNSLSQDLMQQSIRLLRPFGRFLEIGKRDLYRNTPIGLRPLRHNAAYFAIDIDELVAHRPDVSRAVLDEVAALLEVGRLRPLPYRAFGFSEAVGAFRVLQSSGHVGKVVLVPERTPSSQTHPAFAADPNGVYLISGGLSGFGLEAARWLVRHGARKLALIGRRGMDTPGAKDALGAFVTTGAAVTAYACDVADQAQLQPVLAQIRQRMGPISGVLHAAMVLDDASLRDLTASRFAAVLRPKLAGAIALDRMTRNDPINLFVMFSSVTTVIGQPGQANYVAANAALEALAERRQASGLPGLAVQWGPIADAGYLVREVKLSDMLGKLLGSTHLRATQALDALPALLQRGRAVVGLADVAWRDVRDRLPGLATPFWSDMPMVERQAATGQSIRVRLMQLPQGEAAPLIQSIIVEELAAILQQAPATIDVDRPIQEFGVDSLMAVELQTALEARLGLQLPLASLTSAPTLGAIPSRLLQAVTNAEAAQADELAAAVLRYENAELPPPSDRPKPEATP